MIMAEMLKNRIPAILKDRGMSISDLQRRTGLSWNAVYNIATSEEISDQTRIGTLQKISEALELPLGELVN
jgi:DNA-binding Xre family transcriptional regulator